MLINYCAMIVGCEGAGAVSDDDDVNCVCVCLCCVKFLNK